MILTLFSDRRSAEVHVVARHLAGALVAPTSAERANGVALIADTTMSDLPSRVALFHPIPADAAGVVAQACELRATFARVAIVIEGALDERALAAFDTSDRILVITDLSVASLRASQRTLRLAAQLGYAVDKTLVILTGYHDDHAISSADASAALKREIFWKLPAADGLPDEIADSYCRLAERLSART